MPTTTLRDRLLHGGSLTLAVTVALSTLSVLMANPAAADHCLVDTGTCHHDEPSGGAPGSGGNPPPAEPGPATPAAAPDAAARLAQLLNDERVRHGLAPLTLDAEAAGVAQDHSIEMAHRGELFHNDGWFTSTNRQRFSAGRLAENVAMNPDADDAHHRLMQSPGHRANILDATLTHVGVAAADDGAGTIFFTQAFYARRAAPHPVAAATAPTPPPAPEVDQHGERPVTPSAEAHDESREPADADRSPSRRSSLHQQPAMVAAPRTPLASRSPQGMAVLGLLVFAGVTASMLRALPRLSRRRA